jgi:hypothetical protein
MMTVARVIAVSTTVALLSAPAFAQDVTYDVRRSQDLSALRTFSIQETSIQDTAPVKPWWRLATSTGPMPASQRSPWDSPFDRESTNAAVAAQLEARGLRPDNERPDVYVTTHREFQTEFWGYGWPGWDYGYWGYRGYYSYYTDPIVSSTLFIDIRNAETGELLWRGISERNMHVTSSPESRLKRINKEVRKVFKNYPLGTVATSGRELAQPTDR